MQKFYEYFEEIYSEKDQKFIEETGRGKIMYKKKKKKKQQKQ